MKTLFESERVENKAVPVDAGLIGLLILFDPPAWDIEVATQHILHCFLTRN